MNRQMTSTAFSISASLCRANVSLAHASLMPHCIGKRRDRRARLERARKCLQQRANVGTVIKLHARCYEAERRERKTLLSTLSL